MAVYEVVDNETGKTFEIEGDSPPTQEEAANLIKSVAAPQKETPQTKLAEQPTLGGELWKDITAPLRPSSYAQAFQQAKTASEDFGPAVSNLAGASAALLNIAQPIIGPASKLDRGVRAVGRDIYSEFAGTPKDTDPNSPRNVALRNYVLTGRPNELVGEYPRLPDTSSTAINTLGEVGSQLYNYPLTNIALAKGLPAAKTGLVKLAAKAKAPLLDIVAPEQTMVPKPTTEIPKSVKLLRTVAKPTPGTKLSKSWESSGANAVKMLSENYKDTGNIKNDFIASSEAAEANLGNARQSMLEEGTQNNLAVSGKGIKQSITDIGKDPYYEYIDPEGVDFFKKIADKIPDKDIPVQEAQGIYSTLERMLRNARKKAGDAEAALESNDKFQALDSARKSIGDQLNQVLSRTPNEYLENARDFSDFYRVTDRINRAIETFENNPESVPTWRNVVNPYEWKGMLLKWGIGRDPLVDLRSSLRMAKSKGIAKPKLESKTKLSESVSEEE